MSRFHFQQTTTQNRAHSMGTAYLLTLEYERESLIGQSATQVQCTVMNFLLFNQVGWR